MNKKLKLYLIFIHISFIILFLILFNNSAFDIDLLNLSFLLITLVFISNFSMFFNSITDITTSMNLPVLATAFFTLNPFWVGVIAAIGTIELKSQKLGFVWYKFLFNRAVFFISASV
ncbi:MAG: metal-dependent phosphohydrolase, partial [Halanaerobiales bacterium]|nr:metal-dependent phosphohydrolase [Halanaerobiales bacterium]